MAATQPNLVGGERFSQGGTGKEGGGPSEVDKWLGSSSFPAQRSQQPSPPAAHVDPASSDLEVRAARAVAKRIHADPAGGHHWASSFGGVSLDDAIWDLRLHFQGIDNMEKKYSVSSDISYLTILALVELEGYGMDAFLTYVKEDGKGLEGVEALDSEEALEEMLDLFVDNKVLNISVRKATDPSPADEEQIPIDHVGEPVVYRVSQEGVLYPAPDDPYINTQQSSNFNKGKKVVEEEDVEEAADEEEEDVPEEEDEVEDDKSSSDFEFFRGDYRGEKISYKAWCRGEDETGTDTAEHFCAANSEPSEFWEEEPVVSEDEQVEDPGISDLGTVTTNAAKKLKPVRKPGPTSKSHSQPEHIKFEDYVPEADEYCFPGDFGISDEDDAPRLPSGRKSRKKQKKERIWDC
ncbi:hypothetical protein VPH35_075517 [Triticum aestivum]